MNNLLTRSFLSYETDLKKETMKDLEGGGGGEDAIEIEMSSTDESLNPFFEEAGLVREEMSSIRELLACLEDANGESKLARKQETARAVRDRMNANIVEVLKRARRICDRLEGMDRANVASLRLSGCSEGTMDRIRTSVTYGLRKKLKELMMDFQVLRQSMMADYREEVERRYFTVTGDVPSEEVVEKMISEGKSEELIKRAIAGDRDQVGRGKVLETAHDIQDRLEAVKDVERSLLELHQVFLDMAVMVDVQGT